MAATGPKEGLRADAEREGEMAEEVVKADADKTNLKRAYICVPVEPYVANSSGSSERFLGGLGRREEGYTIKRVRSDTMPHWAKMGVQLSSRA